jgi:hypothetical protein
MVRIGLIGTVALSPLLTAVGHGPTDVVIEPASQTAAVSGLRSVRVVDLNLGTIAPTDLGDQESGSAPD